MSAGRQDRHVMQFSWSFLKPLANPHTFSSPLQKKSRSSARSTYALIQHSTSSNSWSAKLFMLLDQDADRSIYTECCFGEIDIETRTTVKREKLSANSSESNRLPQFVPRFLFSFRQQLDMRRVGCMATTCDVMWFPTLQSTSMTLTSLLAVFFFKKIGIATSLTIS